MRIELTALPHRNPLAEFKGPASKGRREEEDGGKWKGREGLFLSERGDDGSDDRE